MSKMKRMSSPVPHLPLAVISQFLGIGIIWLGLPNVGTSSNLWIATVCTVGVLIYTFWPIVCKEGFWNTFSLFFGRIFESDVTNQEYKNNNINNDTVERYIRRLAILDMFVLLFLMGITDGIKSPFSTLILTIPAVTFLLRLSFRRNGIVLLAIFITLIITFFIPCDLLSFLLPSSNGTYSNYFWVTLLCFFAVVLQVCIDHLIPSSPQQGT